MSWIVTKSLPSFYMLMSSILRSHATQCLARRVHNGQTIIALSVWSVYWTAGAGSLRSASGLLGPKAHKKPLIRSRTLGRRVGETMSSHRLGDNSKSRGLAPWQMLTRSFRRQPCFCVVRMSGMPLDLRAFT